MESVTSVDHKGIMDIKSIIWSKGVELHAQYVWFSSPCST